MEKIITDIKTARKKGLLKTGIFFVRKSDGLKIYIPYYFTNRLDLDNLVLYPENETSAFPTLNELVATGELCQQTLYKEHDIYLPELRSCRDLLRHQEGDFIERKLDDIITEFKAHGFNVTKKALLHNFAAWSADMKSGYRDSKNGYHLFTPCGCNPLSFRLTSLTPDTAEWQETYTG